MLLNRLNQLGIGKSANLLRQTSLLSKRPSLAAPFSLRRFSSSASDIEEEEAEVMEYDVLIVGGGPAGKSVSFLSCPF
jgi:hypothetical protein